MAEPRFVVSSNDEAVDDQVVDKVRLVGDGWYIEIRPGENGLEIRAAGTVVGAERLLVIPQTGNGVRVTNDVLREIRVLEEAGRIIAVDKANRAFNRSTGQRRKK